MGANWLSNNRRRKPMEKVAILFNGHFGCRECANQRSRNGMIGWFQNLLGTLSWLQGLRGTKVKAWITIGVRLLYGSLGRSNSWIWRSRLLWSVVSWLLGKSVACHSAELIVTQACYFYTANLFPFLIWLPARLSPMKYTNRESICKYNIRSKESRLGGAR